MKLILVIFTFTFCFNFSIAQKKGDNTIIVHGSVNFNKLKEVLFDEGFIPSNSDTSFITTNYKSMGWNGEVSYMIKRTDSTVTFKGLVFVEFSGLTPLKTALENTGEKISVFRVGFANMSKIATSFGLPVTYLKIKQ